MPGDELAETVVEPSEEAGETARDVRVELVTGTRSFFWPTTSTFNAEADDDDDDDGVGAPPTLELVDIVLELKLPTALEVAGSCRLSCCVGTPVPPPAPLAMATFEFIDKKVGAKFLAALAGEP